MSRSLLVVSPDPILGEELRSHFSAHFDLTVTNAFASRAIHNQVEAMRFPVVLVHLDPGICNGHSPAGLLTALRGLSATAPVIGLLEPRCTDELCTLASTAIPECVPMPVDYIHLKRLVDEHTKLEAELAEFCDARPHRTLVGQTRSLLTFTPAMFDVLEDLKVAAAHAMPVLLVGETGSGKTHLARLIHELSPRHTERCLTVACGALPPDLIESELFGYVKGAFTGADQNRSGKFAAAEKGTLLLDEIDVLTFDQQAKLLRVIETGEYEPVGSNDTQTARAALIVTSNIDLDELVAAGKFRKDLFYRLNTLSFSLPPLRERPLDIEYLTWRFALDHSRAYRTRLRHIDPQFLAALRQYGWPGNIREMENLMRRACLYCRNGVLTPAELPSRVRHAVPKRSPHTKTNGEAATLEVRVREVECQIIEESLRRNNFRRADTAEELGISRVTLYNKMRRFGILDAGRNARRPLTEAIDDF